MVDRVVREEAESAVKKLRLFVSLYSDVEIQPGSREARKLEAARRAIAAYEEAERWERKPVGVGRCPRGRYSNF
jgi:hypothetical protein